MSAVQVPAAPRLSAIIITRNEAANIGACLACLGFADECIVLDSNSEDGTVDIARAAGARVVQTDHWPGFGPQKNAALDLARGRWVLSVDADERISPALAEQILAAISSPGAHSAWRLPRRTRFLGRWIRHCGWTPDYVLRLFRRDCARFSDDLVHERVVLAQGRLGTLSVPIDHHSYPDLAAFWRKTEHFSRLWAHQQFARGRRVSLLQAIASGLSAFLRSYLLRLGFLDGATGLVLCLLLGQGAFIKYLTLIELWRVADAAQAGGQS
ncbi:MAG: glycosyltransferase family 2 protein [Burkholderiaceae bacterium]